ncbi:uncharacterized protein BDW47DRAFT_101015 [Aspergillus candidus]|uniref:Uncharacterized protein n=1 Tax=Aspergillus candidus TaxID=41067 RepID=A0A2I2FJR8_ASPCN|nr:hypothetical protein BDW47DRAFT_101015 [Aspergillus candidus]PLB40885.1 hypothetical protein BDW47DRAFT_101015 [Aspergillus candidus]
MSCVMSVVLWSADSFFSTLLTFAQLFFENRVSPGLVFLLIHCFLYSIRSLSLLLLLLLPSTLSRIWSMHRSKAFP